MLVAARWQLSQPCRFGAHRRTHPTLPPMSERTGRESIRCLEAAPNRAFVQLAPNGRISEAGRQPRSIQKQIGGPRSTVANKILGAPSAEAFAVGAVLIGALLPEPALGEINRRRLQRPDTPTSSNLQKIP